MRRREPAVPLLMSDLLEAKEDAKGANDEQVQHFITPSGASVYRALISGVLMEKEDIGTADSPLFRLRVADPTSGMTIMVGKYNPDLLPTVSGLPCPCFVSLIGKVRTYRAKSGEAVITLNPESITRLERKERQDLLLLAVKDALARVWTMSGRGPHPVRSLAVPSPSVPMGGEELDGRTHDMLHKAIEAYDRSFYTRFMDLSRSAPPSAEAAADDPMEGYEDGVLEMIRSLDVGRGARWDEVIDLIERKRLSRDIIEEVISNLLDKGLLYEPVLGYLKAI